MHGLIQDDEQPEDEGDEGRSFGKGECPTCGAMFTKRRAWAVFCGVRCRMRHHQLERKEAVSEYRSMKRMRFTQTEEMPKDE